MGVIMRTHSKFAFVTVLTLFLFVSAGVHAGNPVKKLGRGIANIAFSPLEIPMKMYDITQEEGDIAGITYGTFAGIGYCIARIGVGIADVVTFPMPLPGCTDDPREVGWGYGPLMRPEWVVDPEHNMFNIFFSDSPMME